MESTNVGLSSPWETFGKKLRVFFEHDDEINVTPIDTTDDNYTIAIQSANSLKLYALSKLIAPEYSFGNVVLKVEFETIVDPEKDFANLIYSTAFAGNDYFRYMIKDKDEVSGETRNYAIFAKDVIQFFNDDLSDYYRNFNGLVQDVARTLFTNQSAEVGDVYYTTENKH